MGKKQCKDCGNLGDKVPCEECAGGFGWICKADKHGQHVHESMGACVDFYDKSKGSLVSDNADGYMSRIDCDVHNEDANLRDLEVLQKLLENYIEEMKKEK